MEPNEAHEREIQVLRDRLARLTEASLRINESLDFQTVLQGVLDSARAMTEARYGVIATTDEAGGLDAVVTSGTTEEEHRQLIELPHRMEIFGHFSTIRQPLRLADYRAYAASVGLDGSLPITVLSGLAAPIGHQGKSVGTIYLGHDQEDQEFTQEDEDTLMMFASQAAMVIANARQHREEQRARTYLETLINTSPVGVAVFDAQTGEPVSFNREARRIVDGLVEQDTPHEQLLNVLTVRRADGREFSLQELSLPEAMRAGEAVRAEEIVLMVPDGRAVTALMNATPVRGDDGEVETFVITLQDITQMVELERMRAEFLAMVSHELRTPLTSVKGSVATLLDPPAALNPTEMRQYYRIIDTQINRMHVLISDLLDVARIETGTLAIFPEPADVASLVSEASNGFRSGGDGHNIEADIEPGLPWVMADPQRIVQVLGNLLNNAARHSPESSTIRVSATRHGVYVAVSVIDRGKGIPAESLPHLFRKFSRLDDEDRSGDTGLGLAICKGIVEAHGGRIWADSDGPGLGARFTFTVPTVEEAGFVSPAPTARATDRTPRSRSAQNRVRILAVDDDLQALGYIRETLSQSGYEPIVTPNPEEALRLLVEERPRLVLLDLVLPGVDGMQLMRDIAETADVPVIFLSAYGQDHLVASAFDEGAADYVVKPFSAVELSARIRAALRRREAPGPSATFVLGDLSVNYAERRVTLAGRPIDLTVLEYGLLAELSANAGRVLTYEQLLQRVWEHDAGDDLRPMRTVVSSLRRKLGDDAENPAYVVTHRRVGYRMPKPMPN